MRFTSLCLASAARLGQQRGRTLLSVAGIALGVALGFAVNLINRAAVEEMAAGTRILSGEADLEVQGGRGGFPQALYPAIARLEGVAVASPVLDLQAGIADHDSALRLIGIDSLRAAQIQPALFADDPSRRFELLKPDAVFLSAAAAESLGLAKGDPLRIVSGLATVDLRVAGVLPASSLRGIAALTDVATAQWRLRRLGELNRIDLRLAPGADREQMRSRIGALLPAGVHVVTADALQESGANLSRAYRVNLNVLALVALFTGGFLVFSAQSLEVVRRRGEHALLRVLGVRRRGILALVLAEAAAIGAGASLLGLALGYGLARVAMAFGGVDLGAGLFRGVAPALSVSPWTAALYFASGIAISMAGAWLPALEASRIAPAQALKAGDEQRMFTRMATITPGLAFLAVALGLTLLRPIAGIPLGGYASIACLLIGGILLMPWLSQTVFARFPAAALKRTPIALALAQLRGAPGQAMVSLAAIVASFSLMVAMAIMVASFRESVDRWLVAALPADLYFRTTHAGETGWIEPAFEAMVRSLPQVSRVEFVRSARVALDPRRPAISLLARDSTEAGEPLRFPLVGRGHAPQPGDPPPAWVSEAVADVYGFRPGDRIELPLGGAPRAFMVAGIWRDYARQNGAIVVPRDAYVDATGDRRANDAALWLAPGATAAQVIEALRRLPGGAQLEISGPGEIRTASLRIFDRTFAVTYALEAVAVLVGLFGLSASVGAIVLARRREFGMLRHVGVTRGQIGEMLAAEGGLLALLGVLAGLALGGIISAVLIFVVNRQSFSWSMDVHLPVGLLLSLSAVLIVLAALTGYLAGREATGMDPVRSVKEDW